MGFLLLGANNRGKAFTWLRLAHIVSEHAVVFTYTLQNM